MDAFDVAFAASHVVTTGFAAYGAYSLAYRAVRAFLDDSGRNTGHESPAFTGEQAHEPYHHLLTCTDAEFEETMAYFDREYVGIVGEPLELECTEFPDDVYADMEYHRMSDDGCPHGA